MVRQGDRLAGVVMALAFRAVIVVMCAARNTAPQALAGLSGRRRDCQAQDGRCRACFLASTVGRSSAQRAGAASHTLPCSSSGKVVAMAAMTTLQAGGAPGLVKAMLWEDATPTASTDPASVVHVVGALSVLLPHCHRLVAQQRLAFDFPLALGLAQLAEEVSVLKPGGQRGQQGWAGRVVEWGGVGWEKLHGAALGSQNAAQSSTGLQKGTRKGRALWPASAAGATCARATAACQGAEKAEWGWGGVGRWVGLGLGWGGGHVGSSAPLTFHTAARRRRWRRSRRDQYAPTCRPCSTSDRAAAGSKQRMPRGTRCPCASWSQAKAQRLGRQGQGRRR